MNKLQRQKKEKQYDMLQPYRFPVCFHVNQSRTGSRVHFRFSAFSVSARVRISICFLFGFNGCNHSRIQRERKSDCTACNAKQELKSSSIHDTSPFLLLLL